MSSSFPEDQAESHSDCISDRELDEMPVNKVTSFRGKLDQFIHPGTNPETPIQDTVPTPEQSKMTNIEVHTPSPRKRNQKSKSAIISTMHTTRVTRSRSTSIPATPSLTPSPRRKRRPNVPSDSPPASTSLLRDTIPPNLILLLVGVNPGIKTGTTGFAYAHPSNLFWRLLHSSGITSIKHPPSDTYKLPELYSVGNTNIVVRPTRDASMLSKTEMDEGVPVLETKIAAQRPEAVCLVGKSIWEAVWRVRHGRPIRKEEFRYGWQDESENMGCLVGEEWGGAPVFVATTTSGLAAGMSLQEKEAVWAELGSWVLRRRAERAVVDSSSA